MATHSSILAWRIPWMEEPGGLQSRGSVRSVGAYTHTHTHTHTHIYIFSVGDLPFTFLMVSFDEQKF